MSRSLHPVIRSGLLLSVIALLGTALLAAVNHLTFERIIEQDRLRILRQLNEFVPATDFDNDLLEDVIEIEDEAFFGHSAPVTVHRARMNGQPVAVMMMITAPDGYNGDIRLLTGIDASGTILGVRVISHKETPGLGDPIELERSNWILDFTGKSLFNPKMPGWKVKKEGGQFDQFTGATISPRAVVRAVHKALLYYDANQGTLFETPAKMVSANER